MGLWRQHLLHGLEADRLAGGAGLGDAVLDGLDHRLGRRLHRVHQGVGQPHLGDAVFDQRLALGVHRPVVVAEALHALGLDQGHLLDQRLQHGPGLGAGLRVWPEQPAVGRVAQIIDAWKLGGHGASSYHQRQV